MRKTNENFENEEDIYFFLNTFTDYTSYHKQTIKKMFRTMENMEMFSEIERTVSIIIRN